METPAFEAPSWLSDQDPETIQARMMERLPEDISSIPGDWPYDLTMPSAMEKSELLQFHAVELLKLMFPQWAYGAWLDLHAKAARITRRPANAAYGHVELSGMAGTVAPAGLRLAVPATSDAPAVEFEVVEETRLSEQGTARAGVRAVLAGPGGNVSAGAISLMVKPLKGLTGVRNASPTSGGTGEEGDEELRQRILERYENQDASYVGCDADYIRWAREVPGVGNVQVMANWDPDTPNSVKVVVLDGNGQPANDQIIQLVHDTILGGENAPLERKAPIGALVTVTAPKARNIRYAAQVLLAPGRTAQEAARDFGAALLAYYPAAKAEGVVRYTQVHALLSGVAGVIDFTGLTLDGGAENVSVGPDAYPVTGAVALSEVAK